MRGDFVTRLVGGGYDEANLPRLEHIRGEPPVAGFQAGVGHRPKAEALPPVVHGVLGIPNPKVDVVDGLDLQEVGLFRNRSGVGQVLGHGFLRGRLLPPHRTGVRFSSRIVRTRTFGKAPWASNCS